MKYYTHFFVTIFICCLIISCEKTKDHFDDISNTYPWCIVAFDSLDRTPTQRIQMLKEIGFTKYAYDWRDKNLDSMERELQLAKENNIEIISVWLWLNAKRDSLNHLSPANEKMFNILEKNGIKTNLWLSFNHNFFEGLSQENALTRAVELVGFIQQKAETIGCKVALYNHRGWFGDPNNQVEIIKRLDPHDLKIVYNFHHAHHDIDHFSEIADMIMPYLTAVNLNGMVREGPEILPIGAGDLEKNMVKILIDKGYNGPWGILGHVKNADVEKILRQNIHGLKSI